MSDTREEDKLRRKKKNTPPLPGQPSLPLDFTPREQPEPEKPYYRWDAYKVWHYRPEPEYHQKWDDEDEEEYDDNDEFGDEDSNE